MQIVQPYARIDDLLLSTLEELTDKATVSKLIMQKIEKATRISHRSEERMGDDTWKKLLEANVVQHADWSVVEHMNVTVDAVVPRGITHEWVRHRLAAYTQESTRFVRYKKVKQDEHQDPMIEDSGIKVVSPYEDVADLEAYVSSFDACMSCEDAYFRQLELGKPPQLARNSLTISTAARLETTMNLRMWRHFFMMRTSAETHPQMKQVTIPLLEEFKSYIRLLFDDIIPQETQKKATSKAR